jgi:hypothetical protein
MSNEEQARTTTQTIKVTVEIGPAPLHETAEFLEPDARIATFMAIFRLMTAERNYAGPDGVERASKGDYSVEASLPNSSDWLEPKLSDLSTPVRRIFEYITSVTLTSKARENSSEE